MFLSICLHVSFKIKTTKVNLKLQRNHEHYSETTPDNCRHFRCIELAIYAPIIAVIINAHISCIYIQIVSASVVPRVDDLQTTAIPIPNPTRTITIGVLLNDRDQFVGQPSTTTAIGEQRDLRLHLQSYRKYLHTGKRERIPFFPIYLLCAEPLNPRLSSRVSHPQRPVHQFDMRFAISAICARPMQSLRLCIEYSIKKSRRRPPTAMQNHQNLVWGNYGEDLNALGLGMGLRVFYLDFF